MNKLTLHQTPLNTYFKGFSFFALLLFTSFMISCSEDPEVIIEPDTLVYLVTLNDEPDLQSLTIVDSLNGRGSMVVPDIQAHLSNRFDLIIDRVDANRANISASQKESVSISTVRGAGFFTTDSVYVELTIDGFTNRDVIEGSR